MDKKDGRKSAGKGRKAKRVFRLKASLQPPSRAEAIAAQSSSIKSDDRIPSADDAGEGGGAASTSGGGGGGGGDGDGSGSDAAGAQERPGLSQPPPSKSDLLLSMERQLRSGVTPTLPTSAHERADLLASSLLPNGSGKGKGNSSSSSSATQAAPALSLREQSPDISSFVVPITPSLTKKRARPSGIGMSGRGSVGRGGGPGRRGLGSAAAAAASQQSQFFVVKEWAFLEKKRGSAAVKKPKFFSALWMMMAAFGDPRGNVTCKCAGRGKKTCPCVDGVAAMEKMVKALGVRLVEVCREWSGPGQIRVKHIRMAMPGEMREYMAWKEAHAKRGTQNEAERGADLHLEGLEEESDDDDNDDDNDDDDDDDHNVDDNREGTGALKSANGAGGGGAANRQVAGGVVGVTGVGVGIGVGVGDGPRAATKAAAAAAAGAALYSDDEAEEANGEEATGAGAGAGAGASASAGAGAGAGAGESGLGNGNEKRERKPWRKPLKMKGRQQQQQQRQGEDDTGEAREWAAEEEDVAIRMAHRKMFADERTASMEEEDYVKTFFEFRKAFFLSVRMRSRGRGGERKYPSGSRGYLARYLGLKSDSREAGDKKLLEALAFMMYDFVGRVVEAAIRKRTGGRLVCGDESDPMLSAEEINAAGGTVPRLSGREQREHVRAFRVANPDGISHNRPLARFSVGLEHRGNPLRWPRNTIEGGRVLVEGGEVVDASDKSLAEEAMALLESDFADF